MPISIDACVAQHQGDRREQQDRVAILPHPRGGGVALAVLADGMGGHTGGVIAAQQVIHTARNNLEGSAAPTTRTWRNWWCKAGSLPNRRWSIPTATFC
ncbi:hypothetical protein [Accumulibacter sp.]|uniref:PP2C family protein-serine/threonine phosphatase n=1 Tax=Accumulibacter sp. TaxID=2053492 RepID=UPI00339020CA